MTRNQRISRCAASLLLYGCLLLSAPLSTAQINPGPPSSAGILTQLAPDDTPPASLHLKPAERSRAIPKLLEVKRQEGGWHKELAAYLLAALGYQYETNRDTLLRVWRKDGDDGTMALLIFLYRQGHGELLPSLLARYDGWNAATSEGLGTFYSEQLEKSPRAFLVALASFPPKRQLELCVAAGGTDGGGMGPDAEARVLRNLKAIGGEAALRCARAVRTGNGTAYEANRDVSPHPLKK